MLKKTLITLTVPLLSVLAISVRASTQPASQTAQGRNLGRADRHVSKDDRGKRKRHHGSRSQRIQWKRFPGGKTDHTAIPIGANSFFPILVFNDLLRGPEPGSMALIPQRQPRTL